MSTELPKSIGPYKVVSRLDRSGSEPVYKVHDAAGRTLAVKLYGSGEPEDLRAFRRDALLKAASLRHPAIVRYEHVDEHEGRVFAAMEFVPSTTLLHRPMPLHRTLQVVRQVAEGLGYLHLQGSAHGCLNPSRVLVSVGGNAVKIMEPGMCTETRPIGMAATATMSVAKMARYIAPEMRRAAATDPDARSDIYSLGALCYEALTGKVPLGRFRLPSQESDDVPPELDEIVLRCLRQEPEARYRATNEFVEAIDRVSATLPGGLGNHLETLTSTARGVLGGGARTGDGWRWASLAGLGLVALVIAVLSMRACG